MNREIERILEKKENYDFYDLCAIMGILRGEGGCPWDREQTHESIKMNFIEETYEVAEAIDNKDADLLCEELGDVLLQVVFHAQMEREKGVFDIDSVTRKICKKLILRHPHVFSDVDASTAEAVLKNWDAIKAEEKHRDTAADKMNSVPPMLPALMRAQKVGKYAAKAGFDFDSAKAALLKVYEEADETEKALGTPDAAEEIGDLLFSVVNTARLAGVDAEEALNNATGKFIKRFAATEAKITEDGKIMSDMTLAEMDLYWNGVKKSSETQKSE